MENLKMSVRAVMATGPIRFRCLYEMPSSLKVEVGLICSIACLFMIGGTKGWRVIVGH